MPKRLTFRPASRVRLRPRPHPFGARPSACAPLRLPGVPLTLACTGLLAISRTRVEAVSRLAVGHPKGLAFTRLERPHADGLGSSRRAKPARLHPCLAASSSPQRGAEGGEWQAKRAGRRPEWAKPRTTNCEANCVVSPHIIDMGRGTRYAGVHGICHFARSKAQVGGGRAPFDEARFPCAGDTKRGQKPDT